MCNMGIPILVTQHLYNEPGPGQSGMGLPTEHHLISGGNLMVETSTGLTQSINTDKSLQGCYDKVHLDFRDSRYNKFRNIQNGLLYS